MNFVQYRVINNPYNVFPSQFVKDLTPDQLRRRKNLVEEREKGVYECIRPFSFKVGEVIWLDSNVVKKRDLVVLSPVESDESEEIDEPDSDEQPETEKAEEPEPEVKTEPEKTEVIQTQEAEKPDDKKKGRQPKRP